MDQATEKVKYSTWGGGAPIAITHPLLAAELADQDLGWTHTAGSNRIVSWRCSCADHTYEWEARICQRSKGTACPVSTGHAVLSGYNDLATLRPDLASQLVDPSLATELSIRSGRRVAWRCACEGHSYEWEARVADRVVAGPCPVRSGKRVVPGINDLATVRPDLAEQLVDPSLATHLTAGMPRKVRWRCALHDAPFEWESEVAHRAKGTGCPKCARENHRLPQDYVQLGVNDLATRRPDLALELVDETLGTRLTYSSAERVWWRCSCPDHTHEWQAVVADRYKGSGCPERARASVAVKRRKVELGINDLATVRPDLAVELVDPSLAETVTSASNVRLEWRCGTCTHVWKTKVDKRVNGSGCPACAGFTVVPGLNDFATSHPELAKRLVDESIARSVVAGSHRRVEWACSDCSRHWWASVKSQMRGSGCPDCATTGFNPAQPGHLYLLIHDEHRLFKVGIANTTSQRVRNFAGLGWSPHTLVEFEVGADAVTWERILLRQLRSVEHQSDGLEDRRRAAAGSHGGFTEMFALDHPLAAEAFAQVAALAGPAGIPD